MPSPLRIAVLKCDTPVPEVDRRYNGYGGVFRALLKSSAKALNRENLDPETGLEVTEFDVVDDDKYPNLEDIDAVLLTGSSAYLLCTADLNTYTNIINQNTTPSKTTHGFSAWSNLPKKCSHRTGSGCLEFVSDTKSSAAH